MKEETALQRLNQRLWSLFIELVNVITEIFEEIETMELFEPPETIKQVA